MKMPTKKTLYIGMIALGLTLFIFSALLAIFRVEELKTLCFACASLGAMLIAHVSFNVLLNWYLNYKAKKHPEAYRKKIVEAKDERNIILWEKALAHANLAMLWVFIMLAVLFILIGADWYVIGTFYGLIAVNWILYLVYFNYYNKRM